MIALAGEDQVPTAFYAYSPFGETAARGERTGNASQYTGRENDGTVLYYYRARYYDPGLKRFVSEDPIGLAGGGNVYAYVDNNPLNWTDPDGLKRGRDGDGRGRGDRGRDNDDSEPWPKDDKSFCIRTYVNCINQNWTGNCQACFDRCTGSASGDWPFHMCRQRKNSCP